MHRGGKIHVRPSVEVTDSAGLAMAYTPGVARVCSAIAERPELAAEYTWVSNTVAVVTDGTAVLGLGDIGPSAAMPVMEGKALLFKRFVGVDAVPVCLACTETDELVRVVTALAPSFGGINLEDISAPRCFEIEEKLRERLDIPVFHDDQHGTAIVTLAALRSAARVTGRRLGDLRVVVAGAGASGVAVSKILLSAGVGDIAVSDSKGLIYRGRDGLNPVKAELAAMTNRAGLQGSTESALRGADVFIGLSGGTVAEPALAGMADGAIVFVLSNPDPEVHPDVARAHAAVVATGRSDFPNQINNSLAFPGVFRGALDVRATDITEGMKLAAADAIAALVGEDASAEYVMPSQFDERVAPAVAAAVAAQARAEGVARRLYGTDAGNALPRK
ncbi:MAG: NADP-dependent malic enzyme [Streptosporangiaceae bacterium]|nr:NADP-dependent malic enzyme [Streptosporangiaceae bacterium]